MIVDALHGEPPGKFRASLPASTSIHEVFTMESLTCKAQSTIRRLQLMRTGIRAVFLVTGFVSALSMWAAAALPAQESALPEAVVITGDQRLFSLRTQMFEAEKKA
jgi:hypothetical protein